MPHECACADKHYTNDMSWQPETDTLTPCTQYRDPLQPLRPFPKTLRGLQSGISLTLRGLEHSSKAPGMQTMPLRLALAPLYKDAQQM